MVKIDITDKKVITPKFRVSFPKLDKPSSFKNQDPKFSVTMLFDKKIDLSSLKKAAHNAIVEKWGIDKKKWPRLKMPFRDGDLEKPDMMGYKGSIFVTASRKEDKPPGIVDHEKEAISGKAVYAGCYARAELIAFAYDTAGNRGVSFSLQNIQKLGEGKKFSGKKDAKDVFDKVEDQSDDPDSYEDMDSDSDASYSADDDDAVGF